jgi:hypothetical protein
MPRATSSANITTKDILDALMEEETNATIQEGEITAIQYAENLIANGIKHGINYPKRQLDRRVRDGEMTKRKVLVGSHWEWAYKKI